MYTDPNGAGDWWLRSPGYFGDYAAMITTDGAVYYNGCSVDTYDGGARPAFHLDLNAVLFTASAAGGKASGDPGADALTAISDYAGADWKLTLLDGSRSFAVTETAVSAAPGGSVTLSYTGATVGTNEYVSAILADSSGKPLYYGRVAQPASAGGTVTISLPAGLSAGSYPLKLFSEQYNGDDKTDYASALQDVTLTVANNHGSSKPQPSGGGGSSPASNPVTVPASSATTGGTVQTSAANARAGDKVTLTLTPDEGYVTAGVTVTDKNGKEVPVTKNADGTYSFTMPATAVTITPNFVKAEEPDDPAGGDVSDRFKDVSKTAWYHDAVQWAVDNGLMNGVSADRFAPSDTTTRAMVVTMLWRMAGEPVVNYYLPYTDVSQDAWYAEAVRWAASAGAVNGTGADTFSPSEPVTREQLAAILYRYAQAQGKGFEGAWMFLLDYPDADQVSDWANEAMHWMVMHGVITGMGDGTLAPGANATRAQIATMFMRFAAEMEK